MEFIIFLGRTFELATAEALAVLAARYPEADPVSLGSFWLKVQLPSLEEAVALQVLLGGTVKIAQIDKVVGDLETVELESEVATLLSTLAKDSKIDFGVAEIGRNSLQALHLIGIKKELAKLGVSSRFVESTREGLSASVLLHQNVDEVMVLRFEGTIYLGHTIAIQNIDEWSERDRSKPAFDKKHGMLPPKVARMMLNLAMPGESAGKRVLDPFCGTGTVVLEAMTLGIEGIGSDLRIEAVGQTQKNAEWLQKTKGITTPFRAVVSDATKLTPELLGGFVDAIVAEGFLGPLTPKAGALPNIFKGIGKLYKGSFKQWTKILNPGSLICIALPRVKVKNTIYSLSELIDSLEEFGYNSVSSPFIYDRPDAVVQREIFVLRYKSL